MGATFLFLLQIYRKLRSIQKIFDIIRIMYCQNETALIALGEKIGRALETGQVLVLTGELGAGKTTLTKGLALGLGVTQMIKSPTYTILRVYEGRLPLNHLDVYRIGDDPDSIDLDEVLYGEGVTVIEWGELLDARLLGDYLTLTLHYEGEGRRLDFQASGPQSQAWLEKFLHAAD